MKAGSNRQKRGAIRRWSGRRRKYGKLVLQRRPASAKSRKQSSQKRDTLVAQLEQRIQQQGASDAADRGRARSDGAVDHLRDARELPPAPTPLRLSCKRTNCPYPPIAKRLRSVQARLLHGGGDAQCPRAAIQSDAKKGKEKHCTRRAWAVGRPIRNAEHEVPYWTMPARHVLGTCIGEAPA